MWGKVWLWTGLNGLQAKPHRVVEVPVGTHLWDIIPFFTEPVCASCPSAGERPGDLGTGDSDVKSRGQET